MLQSMCETPLESFDTAYYSEKLKKAQYDLDEEEYRPYFEQQSVVNGFFDFLGHLFGVVFQPVTCKLWNNKARAYDLYVDDVLRARLYLDLEASYNFV